MKKSLLLLVIPIILSATNASGSIPSSVGTPPGITFPSSIPTSSTIPSTIPLLGITIPVGVLTTLLGGKSLSLPF